MCQFLFGILLLLYVPSLDPYPGYTPIRTESLIDDMDYEPLPGEEQICPERKSPFDFLYRFWLGGFFKIGNDASQFVGPLILNRLLLVQHCHGLLTKGVQELACTCVVTLETGESMQQGEPAWHGYIYAFSIFAGVVCVLSYAGFSSWFLLREALTTLPRLLLLA
ncbi:hypothetical protein B296_00043147 [Ensete ventricosum]|uniref:Uncharacterized protein n=1 Tax=Ensete ventricosum TaxID=4639 RepID=A0A426ZFW9_ENSVE|nr:hypothetical protein B296_00043147 [Ensete ventricosum]